MYQDGILAGALHSDEHYSLLVSRKLRRKSLADTNATTGRDTNSFISQMSSVGPGLVYALTILGTGDLITNASAGGGYGYSLIWALGFTLILRYVWVNTSAKYVLVTGESLMQGYARLGSWFIWLMLFALIILRHVYNLYQILMMGSAVHILVPLQELPVLTIPTEWSMPIWGLLFTGIGFVMMFWGGYSVIETFCKILVGVMGCALVVAALLSNPDPVGIAKGFIPNMPEDEGLYSSMLILMALIGTEAGSMTNLTYAYFIYEKGWTNVRYMKRQRFDLGFGVVALFIMGTLLQIAAAGTVGESGVQLETAEDLVKIFSGTMGDLGRVIFGLGLWGAAFSTFIGGTVGYALIITDLCRNLIPKFQLSPGQKFENIKNDPIYRWSIIIWTFSPIYIVFTGVRPVWLILIFSSLMVVMIPVLALALMVITNKTELMGKYKNGWLTNAVLILLVAISFYMIGKEAIPNVIELLGI